MTGPLLGAVEHDLPSRQESQIIDEILRGVDCPAELDIDVAGPLRVLRFLRGRLGNKAEAAELFQAMLRWRLQECRFRVEDLRSNVIGLSLEDFQRRFAAKPERQYLPSAFLGRSRQGGIVALYKAGMWDIEGLNQQFDENAMLRHEVEKMEWVFWYFQECCKREDRVPYLVVLLDLEGASSKLLQGETRNAVMDMAKSLGAFYLDAVEVTIVINAPWVFRAARAMMAPLLTERQKAKVRMLGSLEDSANLAALHATIAPELLPVALGGSAAPDVFGDQARKLSPVQHPPRPAPRSTGRSVTQVDSSMFAMDFWSCCMGRDVGPTPSSPQRYSFEAVPAQRSVRERAVVVKASKGNYFSVYDFVAVCLVIVALAAKMGVFSSVPG
ncbi:unnamed protein product [Polarella glacialis]|uniref:CRAL-TRIO domain-containing protein n=1 Tax=Polarella glacialis TaxID=89957 RepID=A0A813GZ84_POLGL|nr:unnamed protein product [Polarella glacialis]